MTPVLLDSICVVRGQRLLPTLGRWWWVGIFLTCPLLVQFPEKGKSSPQVFRGIVTQGSGPTEAWVKLLSVL